MENIEQKQILNIFSLHKEEWIDVEELIKEQFLECDRRKVRKDNIGLMWISNIVNKKKSVELYKYVNKRTMKNVSAGPLSTG